MNSSADFYDCANEFDVVSDESPTIKLVVGTFNLLIEDLNSKPYEAAKQLSSFGFIVLPANFANGAKKPAIKFAHLRDTITADNCLNLWKGFENAQAVIGLTDNNLFVLDADTKESLSALHQLEKEYDKQPNFAVKTEKGEHHYFKLAPNTRAVQRGYDSKKWLSNIDIRTGKSIVMMPPSVKLNGAKYEIDYCEAEEIGELIEVDQTFIDAVFAHNKDELPTEKRLTSPSESWDGTQAEINEATTLLSFIDSDCNYDEWMTVFYALVDRFGRSETAFNLFDNWSKSASNYSGTELIAYKLNTISTSLEKDGGVSFSSLAKLADDNGANLGKINATKETEALKEKYPSLSACFAVLENEQKVDEHSVAFDAAIAYIALDENTLTKGKAVKKLKAVSGVAQGDIKGAIKETTEKEVDLTHFDMYKQYAKPKLKNGIVGQYGKIWNYCEVTAIWVDTELSKVATSVAQAFNTEVRCAKGSDYKAISNLIYDSLEEKDFFIEAPKGVNTPDGFISVRGNKLVTTTPTKEDRCTFCVSVSPVQGEMPLFDGLLLDAFGVDDYEEQRKLLLTTIGLSIVGLMPAIQRALLLYGVGASGKSVILKIIEALIPPDARCAVKPELLDSEYHMAALAGKRFNIVPEIDKDKPIPSADFKAMVSADSVSARVPYGKVFIFKPYVANWFNGNHFPVTRDRSSAFWRRWYIIHFKNVKPEAERVLNLEDKIIKNELGHILYEALSEVQNYLDNGEIIEEPKAHKAALAQWQNNANSVLSWLSDDDNSSDWGGANNASRVVLMSTVLTTRPSITVKEAYAHYSQWCRDSGRKPLGKIEFKSAMEEAGHSTSLSNGYEVYKTLCFM